MTETELQPTAVVVEIIEKGAETSEESAGRSVIVPDEIRLNGRPILTSAHHPVVINQIEALPDDTVYVTITMLARRVVIGGERDVAPVLTSPDADVPDARS